MTVELERYNAYQGNLDVHNVNQTNNNYITSSSENKCELRKTKDASNTISWTFKDQTSSEKYKTFKLTKIKSSSAFLITNDRERMNDRKIRIYSKNKYPQSHACITNENNFNIFIGVPSLKKQFYRSQSKSQKVPSENRFSIHSGHVWDGIERGNGFEKHLSKYLCKRKSIEENFTKQDV